VALDLIFMDLMLQSFFLEYNRAYWEYARLVGVLEYPIPVLLGIYRDSPLG
jgi:hypothetical protein